MESKHFTPDKALKKIWYIIMVICLIFFLMVITPLFLLAELEALIMLGVIFLIIYVPFLIWIPAYFKSLKYSYDQDSVDLAKGVIWKKEITVPFHKITNLDIVQGPLDRIFGLANIQIQTAGGNNQQGTVAELILVGLKDYREIRTDIMNMIKQYRQSNLMTSSEPDSTKKEISIEQSSMESEVVKEILTELREIKDILQK